jgi:hypothetical protein
VTGCRPLTRQLLLMYDLLLIYCRAAAAAAAAAAACLMQIKLPRVSGIVLRERYKNMTYVPISKARCEAGQQSQCTCMSACLNPKP